MENQTGGRDLEMNILFLNSSKRWGGNEHWTALAANGLAVRNEVYLAYRGKSIAERFFVRKYRLPFLNEFDLITLFQLIILIKKWKIDTLIPTKRKDYVLAGFAAKATGVKNVFRLGIERQLENTRVNRFVYNSLCDGIIVNAKSIQNKLLQSGFIKPEKIRVIYNGVDFPAIHEKAEEKNGFVKPFDFTITAMGELTKRKEFDFLLKAFSIFKKSLKPSFDCGVAIIGSGPEKRYLQEMAQNLEIKENIAFTGFMENPYPLIGESDVFVQTSRTEGIPNAMLEAMALKRPIITTTFGAAKEVIQNGVNGCLLDQGNPAELADHLTEMHINQNNRRKMALEGFRSVNQIFSMERMIREIEQFCDQV